MTKKKTKTLSGDRQMQLFDKSANDERIRLDREFTSFAETKGWDEDRKVEVLAELSYPEPVDEMLDEIAKVGWTDGLLRQLHQYYDKEDYFTTLLQKLVEAKPTAAVNSDLLDAAIAKLNGISAA